LNYQQDNSKTPYRTQKSIYKRENNLGTMVNMGKTTKIRNKAKAIGKQNILNDFLVNAKTIDQQPIEKPLDMEKNWLRGGPKWEFLENPGKTGKMTKFRYRSLRSGDSGNFQDLYGKTTSPNKFNTKFGEGSNPFQTMYARGDNKGLSTRALADTFNLKKETLQGASTPQQNIMGILQDSPSDDGDGNSPGLEKLNMFDRDEWQDTTKAWLFLPGANGNIGRETPVVGLRRLEDIWKAKEVCNLPKLVEMQSRALGDLQESLKGSHGSVIIEKMEQTCRDLRTKSLFAVQNKNGFRKMKTQFRVKEDNNCGPFDIKKFSKKV
jgi:hypothetical protein